MRGAWHPDLAQAERDEIESEARERTRNAGKAPRAEALYAEVQGIPALWDVEMVLGMRIEEGRDLEDAEERAVRERLQP